MELDELKKTVDLYSLIEQSHNFKRINYKGYCHLNPCPKCGGNDHFTYYPESNSYSSFSHCCEGGSVIDYLMEFEGFDNKGAIKELYRLAGEEMPSRSNKEDDFQIKIKKASPQQPEVKEAKDINYTQWLNKLYENMTDDDKQFFLNRGITAELIKKYKLCIGPIKNRDYAIIPFHSNNEINFYVGRALDNNEPRYKNAGGEVQLFNIEYLKTEHNEPLFITEGIFDALSLEALGYKAIATNSASNTDKIMKAIKNANTSNIFLTAFDNDDAGKNAAAELPYKSIIIPDEYKDINEWYMSDNAIKENIDRQLQTATQPDAIISYLENGFFSDVDKLKEYKDKKTGFANLDKEMNGLFPGLYVIGGISSVGKTTFVHQLGDQLAEQGDHVIYFSLEQSKLEMVSKSLSRMTARKNILTAIESVQIRSGYKSDEITTAMHRYKDIANKVNVIEGNFNTDVTTIRKYVEDYIKFNNVRPVVIVDYLQIMPAMNDRLSDKQRIDTNVTELKRMSRDLDIVVFVISSLNRGNYLAPIDFESFKESGGIEYTADVVWGLQLEIINDESFNSDKNIKEKREKMKKAKSENPRKIELVCLKNRNGKPSFTCSFSYWAKYDFYEPKNPEFFIDISNIEEII